MYEEYALGCVPMLTNASLEDRTARSFEGIRPTVSVIPRPPRDLVFPAEH
jgi:hypothetical protein